jgi:hypothetical protein
MTAPNHSCLRAAIGSERMARRAGKYAASSAIAVRSSGAKSSVVGSKILIANRLERTKRDAATYASKPMTQPARAMLPAFARIIHPIFALRAPSATLTANSRLRSETTYEITPNSPIAASSNARMEKLPISRVVKRRCATDSETSAASVVVS